MNHKEALEKARAAVRERNASMSQFFKIEHLADEESTVFMSAYLEARGLVMVPRIATPKMHEAAVNMGVLFSAAAVSYDAMLAAVPDPFEDQPIRQTENAHDDREEAYVKYGLREEDLP